MIVRLGISDGDDVILRKVEVVCRMLELGLSLDLKLILRLSVLRLDVS